MLEHWFRRDDESESDENSLWSSIRPLHPPTSPQSDGYTNQSDKNNEVDSV
jgi:hypothetical protein